MENVEKQDNILGNSGMTIGIVSRLFCWNIGGVILSIVSIILSYYGLAHPSKGMAIAGLACSAATLIENIVTLCILGFL